MPPLHPRPLSAPTRGSAVTSRRGRLGAVLALAVAVSGCAAAGGAATDATPSASVIAPTAATDATPSPTPTPTADPTAFDADADVEHNLAVFRSVVEDVWAGDGRTQGRAYVDALVAAGFSKAAMEVTADTTTIGNAAETIQVAVLWREQCLIGQVGPATGEPVAVSVPALAEGRCLVGDTRPIDW
ncbi:hypothetical protein P0L94_04140 [Microbacter sp. GSS18]|nr:hypothetical protein P0L94_04140 [Microbacter sp. GSS18]